MPVPIIRTFLVSFAAIVCAAQSSFIRGHVEDPSGKPVDGARVALFRQGSTAPLLATVSGQGGVFELPAVGAAGAYLMEVTADGFAVAAMPAPAGDSVVVRLKLSGVAERVFVTAEASAQTVDQIAKATSGISADEISGRDENSLSEALRDTPGVLVRNLGGPGQSTSIRMRGLRADATSILIDGLRFRDAATTQGDASSFVSTLNIVNPDRVEILRGSGSSLYGTNAVGGAINVVTDSGGGRTRGAVLAEGGSLGFLRGKANASGSLAHQRVLYSIGLVHLNVLSGVDGDDRARSSGVHGFARYTTSARASLSSRWLFSDDFVQPNLSPTASGIPAANIPSTVVVTAIPLAPDQVRNSALGLPIVAGNATYIPNRNDPDNRRASRFWSGALTGRLSITPALDGQASYQRVHTNRVFQNGPAGAGSQPKVSNFSQFTGDIDTVDTRVNWRPAAVTSLTAGYEFEREGYLNGDDNRLPAPVTVTTKTVAAQRSNSAYAASQSMFLNRRLQVSFSGRTQVYALDRPKFEYTGVANPYGAVALPAPPQALTGDTAVSYFIGRSSTKIRAHAGNSYRAPGIYERFGSGFFYNSTNNSVAFSPHGDPRLAPDRYNSADAGVDQYLLHQRMRVSATWFYTRIVQLTQFDSVGSVVTAATDPFARTSGYYNGAGGISRGAEVSVEFEPFRSAFVRSSYSYTNADTDQDSAVRGFYRALSVPPHTWTVFWRQRVTRRTDAIVDVYRSGEYYNSLSAAGRARAYRYPGFTKIDAVITRTLHEAEAYSLRWHGKVENVLNQRYYENGFQAPMATFVTGLAVHFR